MANKTEEAVEKIALELLAAQPELELVDVEYVKERDWYLRVYIDKDGGIDIDDCQKLSEVLEEELDKNNVVAGSYILEVSSPGLDRVLRKDRDFVREHGKMVDVTLYKPIDGLKMITGKLTAYDKEKLTLDEEREIPVKQIAQVRLHIDF